MAIVAAGGLIFFADTEAEIPVSGLVVGAIYYAVDTKRWFTADSTTTTTGGYSHRLENRTDDPGTPVAGQMWLRTDL